MRTTGNGLVVAENAVFRGPRREIREKLFSEKNHRQLSMRRRILGSQPTKHGKLRWTAPDPPGKSGKAHPPITSNMSGSSPP